jgi:hypothetical protein
MYIRTYTHTNYIKIVILCNKHLNAAMQTKKNKKYSMTVTLTVITILQKVRIKIRWE